MLNSFLQSIGKYKLKLNFASNHISNAKIINKYFVNAEGDIPVQFIDICDNWFQAAHLSLLAKVYLERKQADPIFMLEMRVGQI